MYRVIIITFLIFVLGQITYAKDIEVNIHALNKITTSNVNLKEGDSVTFAISKDVYLENKIYLKSGEKVTGVITSMQDNNFVCEPATIYIENFETKNAEGKVINLKGNIYAKGRTHWMLTQFLDYIPELIRGGEVQIKKNDAFTIHLGEKL